MRITHNEQPLSKKTEFFTLSPQKGYNGFMAHTIYYFTGTGNSLWTARELKKNFKRVELVSIPSVSGEKKERIFNTARAKIKRISGIVQNQISSFDKEANFFHTHLFPRILYSTGYKFIHFLDKNFSVEETCNSCGICEKICPVKNIILTEGKPVWNKNCQMCFACINNCPQNAIQYGGKTRGLKRYRNPEISLSDLIN